MKKNRQMGCRSFDEFFGFNEEEEKNLKKTKQIKILHASSIKNNTLLRRVLWLNVIKC